MKNALQNRTEHYTIATAAELAEKILQNETGNIIYFTVANVLQLSPWETPEKHYIQKRDFFRDHVLIAGRESGGYTKITTINELLPPERQQPISWDLIGFINRYLQPFNVQRVAIIEQ